MSKTTVKLFQTIKESIPSFIREEFPLFGELLEQYYICLEKKTGVYDILNQINEYIKIDEIVSASKSTNLTRNIFDFETTIQVESTLGFPETNGTIKIDDEIIFYKEKTDNSFLNCSRGFSGLDSFGKSINFSKNSAQDHDQSAIVINLYSELLAEFLFQIKKQILPGLESANISTNQNIFLKQSIDLYNSKGSEESFRILFAALFGVPAKIIRPQEDLFEPSKSYYNVTTDLLVEPITGDIEKCLNRTVYQFNKNGDLLYGTVTSVEKVNNLGREYYILSIDFNYDRDIINKGSLFGVFDFSKRTIVLEDVTLSSSNFVASVYVNSTLGFLDQDILQVKTPDGQFYDLEYFDKNANQFFVVPNGEIFIPKNSYLTTKNFAFCNLKDETIEMRICPIFSNDFSIDGNSLSVQERDPVVISSLGENILNSKFNDWVFNLRNRADVESIKIEDSQLKKYKIEFFNEYNNFYLKDKFDLISSDGDLYELQLTSKNNNKIYTFSSNSTIRNIDTPGFYAERKISKSAFNQEFAPGTTSIANVQNVYSDTARKDIYVETGSIPSYGDNLINIFSKKIVFNGNYSSEVDNFTLNIGKNKLLTGDVVVYTEPTSIDEFVEEDGTFFLRSINNPNRLSIPNGKYYVKVIDNQNIKLSVSQSKLYNNQFISFSGSFTNNSLYYANTDWLTEDQFSDYVRFPESIKVEHQKLIRKISDPVNTSSDYETKPGTIGIFKNGTELLNYKSLDSIHYGSIKTIDVLSGGQDFDVINRPQLVIDDTSLGVTYGSGASGQAKISGSLKRIDVLNSGVGFLNEPSIKISGGNGFGAVAAPIFESAVYSVDFNSSNSVSLVSNEIIFQNTSYFITGEVVRYFSGTNTALGGLTNNSTYFVRQSSSNRIKLYRTIEDCNRSINEINITSFGTGVQSIISVKNRKLLADFKIISEGSGYKSTKLIFQPSAVNIYDDSLNIDNHNLETGEVVVYTPTDIPVAGIASTEKYYVYKINESKIQLSSSKEDLQRKLFVNLTSTGQGSHVIEYDPIEVTVTNLDGNNNNTLSIRPIFRGSVESITLNQNGSGYGTNEIINFDRQPSIYLETGSKCKLKPLIIDGKIFDVVIENQGSGYDSIPDLEVFGDGTGAKLLPVITEGRITDVIIQSSGFGYSQNTTIFVNSSGSGAEFFGQIDKWTINLVEKEFFKKLVSDDDAFLSRGKFGIKYAYCYTPRKLREYVLTRRIESGVERFIPDLSIDPTNNKESDSRYHSPILGWAYDGNPIYGPYGFSNPDGTGQVRRLKSGYKILQKSNRPQDEIKYPLGIFVEDYEYFDGEDLDEHNGRFCVTPEYPNGIYAYFSTVGDIDPSYKNYRKPQFPYVIGNTYKSDIIEFNFNNIIDQNSTEVYSKLLKNTNPYNLFEENSGYDGIDIVDLIENHTSEVEKVSTGSIDFVSIISRGNDYKVDDRLVFDNSNTNSFGLSGFVDSIKGKTIVSISQTSKTISNVEIYGYSYGTVAICSSPHNITDIGNYIYYFDKIKNVSEFYPGKFKLVLVDNLASSSITGVSTYIGVSGLTNSNPFVFENDIFKIDNEELKIIEVDKKSSRLRVLRSQNGTVGLSHTAGAILEEKSRKLYSPQPSTLTSRQRQIYFNPRESIGIGTSASVLNISNPSFYPSIVAIDPGKIYIRDHFLQTNDVLIYNSNSNFPIRVEKNSNEFSLQENQKLYVYRYSNDFIGIYDEPILVNEFGQFVGVSSTTSISLFNFTDYGSGDYHSFKVSKDSDVFVDLNQYNLQVTTNTNHLLNTEDTIDFNFKYEDEESVKVVYNIKNRRFCVNPIFFVGSSIDLDENTIFIENHGFKSNQKVIYKSSSPSNGLVDDQIYYVNFIDNNKISLLDLNKNIVNIQSQSFGNILPINPDISLEKNKSIVFDLSDESLSFIKNNIRYSGFILNVYTDQNYKNKLDSTGASNSFNVTRIGKVGIDANAKLILSYDEKVPDILYYKLDPVKNENVPNFISETVLDKEFAGAKINYSNSQYTNSYKIVKVSNTSFKFSLGFIPKNNLTSEYEANYNTSSKNASGSVNTIKFDSKGNDFTKIPFIKNIESQNGKDFFGILYSSNIGSVKTLDIDNIKYELASDPTLIPKGLCPISVKVEPLSSVEKIETLEFGIDYTQLPDLILIDGFTKKPVFDIVLDYNEQSFKVDVLKNTNGIYNVNPTIIPINNTNGYKILSLTYDDFTKNATVVLDTVGFSTITAFPFEVGSKFLIENLVTLNPESDLGYNSENYDYKLYTVVSSDPNIGGQIPSVTFSMEDFSGSTDPGVYDTFFTSARIIPERFFPKFKVTLKKNIFFENEIVTSGEFEGTVLSWDKDNEFLKVRTKSPELITSGSLILGESSSSFGTISDVVGISTVNYNLTSLRSIKKGWLDRKGFLNNEYQRLHDSDYYQYFSYAVQSTVDNSKWDTLVQDLNHTAGFKRFSNLSVESDGFLDQEYEINNEGSILGIANIDAEVNLNCIYDYDLVTENNISVNLDKVISDEIIFNSKLLQDNFVSSGNRVLIVDDISAEFNSNSRSTPFSVANQFVLEDFKYRKYFIYTSNKFVPDDKQAIIVNLIQDGTYGFLNQYARVETIANQGYFDFTIFNNSAFLQFFPEEPEFSDYDIAGISLNIGDNLVGVATTAWGDVATIETQTVTVSSGATSGVPIKIFTKSQDYRASKYIITVESDNSDFIQSDEFNVVNAVSDVLYTQFGSLETSNFSEDVSSGFATYYPVLNGSEIDFYAVPNSNTLQDYKLNIVSTNISNDNFTNVGIVTLTTSRIFSSYSQIAGSPTTGVSTIITTSPSYKTFYVLASIEDTTNNIYEFKELVIVRHSSEVYLTEFGRVISDESISQTGIGTFTGSIDNITDDTYILFEPLPNRNVEVRCFTYALELLNLLKPGNSIDLDESNIAVLFGDYTGTQNDIRRTFELTYKDLPIFDREFNSEDSSVVLLEENSIIINNHFFNTGEKIYYSYPASSFAFPSNAIGITTTVISGISTNKLPSELYVIKINDSKIKFAATAEDALKFNPISLDLSSVGIGSVHKLTASRQNVKGLFTIDNVVQSPIQETKIILELTNNVNATDNLIKLSGISSIGSGDILKINDEIVFVERVGVSSEELLRVRRRWLGTNLQAHSIGSTVTKLSGNYNIIDSTINFVTAPFGKVPLSLPQNELGVPFIRPDDRDFTGITTNSTFSGRVFLRTGEVNSSEEIYEDNYLFDDISRNFTGITSEFTLKTNDTNIVGISSNNALILIKDIFQQPERSGSSPIVGNYKLIESSGQTKIQFNPSTQEVNDDINVTSLPVGGKIISVGSTAGFGYQSLVSAGATATISGFGTISQISIGNSGSGYRSGIQTFVNVYSETSSAVEIVGIASISNGRITSVTVTNPGTSYTNTNPPLIKFDAPLGYSNIPLVYSNQSVQGVGTGAKIDFIVSRDSSVFDFEIKNNGYNYKEGEILTVDISQFVGIPTDQLKPFREFQITVNKTQNDEFTAWSIGDVQQLDQFDDLFNGVRKVFPIRFQGSRVSIVAKNGSNIDVEATLLIFINGILQVPGKSYTFKGGSLIIFEEAPKKEYFSNVLFYRGTKDIDVTFVDLIEEIEPGDTCKITSDISEFNQNQRQIENVISADIVSTTPYSGPGVLTDDTFLRPITICRQTEDLFLNGSLISKDRSIYEPFIIPTTNIIQNVDINSTEIFVESLKTFFDNRAENITNKDRFKVELISQENTIGGVATAIVSAAGSITSIDIVNPGYGYTFIPQIAIANPPEYSLSRISAELSLTISDGKINSISVGNSGRGYDPNNPPIIIIEHPTVNIEEFVNVDYEGDFGILVGIANTTVGVGITALQMDFYIDNNSFLKNPVINPGISANGTSGIATNYFFAVSNSNIGLGVTSLYVNGNVLSTTNLYFDNIFQVYDLQINQKQVIGVGTTAVVTVKTRISSLFDLTLPLFDSNLLTFDSTNFRFDSNSNEFSYFGNYSWGRISFNPANSRKSKKQFNSYYQNGYSGLSTSSIVKRVSRLKSSLQSDIL
jgi:hypothetical protein